MKAQVIKVRSAGILPSGNTLENMVKQAKKTMVYRRRNEKHLKGIKISEKNGLITYFCSVFIGNKVEQSHNIELAETEIIWVTSFLTDFFV